MSQLTPSATRFSNLPSIRHALATLFLIAISNCLFQSPFSFTIFNCYFQLPFPIAITIRHLQPPFPIAISNRHFQSSVPIAISNRHYQSPFLIAIFNRHFQSPVPIAITNYHFQLLLPIPITNRHFQPPFPIAISNRHFVPGSIITTWLFFLFHMNRSFHKSSSLLVRHITRRDTTWFSPSLSFSFSACFFHFWLMENKPRWRTDGRHILIIQKNIFFRANKPTEVSLF